MSTMEFDENYVFGEEYVHNPSPFQNQLTQNYIRKYSDNSMFYQQEQNIIDGSYQHYQGRKLSCDPQDFKIKYKTEWCKYIQQRKTCPYKDQCAFAHHASELRYKTHLPSNYKTKKCKNFHENGYCSYGQRCQFLHSQPQGDANLGQNSNESLSNEGLSDQNNSQNKPKKTKYSMSGPDYTTQLQQIGDYWDKDAEQFQSPNLVPRPRLSTFEKITSRPFSLNGDAQDKDDEVENEENNNNNIVQNIEIVKKEQEQNSGSLDSLNIKKSTLQDQLNNINSPSTSPDSNEELA